MDAAGLRKTFATILFGVLMVAGSSSSAATLQTSGTELIGALNVSVNGTLYNVEFVEGSCPPKPYLIRFSSTGLRGTSIAIRRLRSDATSTFATH
jgi:hypothetical protein